VIFVIRLEDKAVSIAANLESEGFKVCLHCASEEDVRAAKGGAAVNSDIAKCLDGADVCVFLIDDQDQFSGLGWAAVGAGARVVGVLVGTTAKASADIDEIGSAVLPIHSDNLIKALAGDDIWEGADGKSVKPRNPRRQKCQ
jgi:hypothetical protein